ncbi:MAG TPA: hypothetical protein VFV07_02405, partial [Rhizomicrobium sp.]|nr:hypothetical protein [Rhizomicrobium sp.]
MASVSTSSTPSGGWIGIVRAISRPSWLAFGVGVLSILSGIVTYAALTKAGSYNLSQGSLIALLIVNLALGLTLGGLIAWRLARLWIERRSGRAGAKLHVRLVTMFSTIAVVPAILVAIFAAVTLNLGMESWFSSRVKLALDNAVGVAHQYALETSRGIILDAGEMADGIQQDRGLFDEQNHVKVGLMIEKLAIMTNDRGLVATFLVDSHGTE